MKIITYFLFSVVIATVSSQSSHPTPPPIPCDNSNCVGKADGNHAISPFFNYFLQCSEGRANCQACWPLDLIFSPKCNQCLYARDDPCTSTNVWIPEPSYACPRLCEGKSPTFIGNIQDPMQTRHYIACWHGVTVGCIKCPSGLEFNETWNACLWEGKYNTRPVKK